MTAALRIASLAALLVAGTAAAQIVPRLPPVGVTLGELARTVDRAAAALPSPQAVRLDRIAALLRAYPGRIALDPAGFPARAREVIVSDPDAALLGAADAGGFRLIERGETLGIGYARLRTPPGMSLKAAIRLLSALGGRDVSADPLHFESGAVAGAAPPAPPAIGKGNATAIGPIVGMIDGGVAGPVAGQRGFADGAPHAGDHATAVASLIAGAGKVRGAAPGARLRVADVYGTDPAGGSASAIARALGWLAGDATPVVTISLVGPRNPLLARVVAAAQARGTIIVAAVGNDGPAAPPGYPASYPGVIAVTGVDGRNRVLIEAGRATHLDYAAPAADMVAADAHGGVVAVRGTSFAAPLVAATIARAYPRPDNARRAAALAAVDAQARPLGRRYGRGLVCEACRTTPR